jgi:hypothetical protein
LLRKLNLSKPTGQQLDFGGVSNEVNVSAVLTVGALPF